MPRTPLPCSYSVPNPTPGPTLNAYTPLADTHAGRDLDRLGMCHRLAALGMEYAEAAQREGLRDLEPRPERRPPLPGMYMPPTPPPTRDTTLGELFSILSRCTRQAILLEARLDSGAFDHQAPLSIAPPAPAPHRSTASPRASEPGDGTRLDHETLDDDLAADARRTPSEILVDICEQLGRAIATPHALSQAIPAPSGREPHIWPPKPHHPLKPSQPPAKPPPKPG